MTAEQKQFIHDYLKRLHPGRLQGSFEWRVYTQYFQNEFELRKWVAPDAEIMAEMEEFYKKES